MTDTTITKAEAQSRLRYIRGGEWDDAIIFTPAFVDGVHSSKTTIVVPTPDDVRRTKVRLATSTGPVEFPVAHVTRVVR